MRTRELLTIPKGTQPSRTQEMGRTTMNSWDSHFPGFANQDFRASDGEFGRGPCESSLFSERPRVQPLRFRRIGWLIFLATVASLGRERTMAHPVSFRGSTGVMLEQSPMMSNFEINYSFRHWWALGAWHIRRPDTDKNRYANLVSLNFLLHRWNADTHQANLYAIVGVGESRLAGDHRGIGFSNLQFDIENRSLYFLARHSEMLTPKDQEMRQTVVRAGFAPYLDPYDGIHSWILLEWQEWQFGDAQASSDLTPFLRLFYRNVLVEFGQSINGVTRFNLISHF